jgi:UDP-N-acetylglucosamine 2-epimerase
LHEEAQPVSGIEGTSVTAKQVGYFTFMWPCKVTNFFVIKPIRCTNFTNLFCHETLHVSDSSSVHNQEFILCTLSNGICHTGL